VRASLGHEAIEYPRFAGSVVDSDDLVQLHSVTLVAREKLSSPDSDLPITFDKVVDGPSRTQFSVAFDGRMMVYSLSLVAGWILAEADRAHRVLVSPAMVARAKRYMSLHPVRTSQVLLDCVASLVSTFESREQVDMVSTTSGEQEAIWLAAAIAFRDVDFTASAARWAFNADYSAVNAMFGGARQVSVWFIRFGWFLTVLALGLADTRLGVSSEIASALGGGWLGWLAVVAGWVAAVVLPLATLILVTLPALSMPGLFAGVGY